MQIQKKFFEGSDLTTEGLVGDFPKITEFLILTEKKQTNVRNSNYFLYVI